MAVPCGNTAAIRAMWKHGLGNAENVFDFVGKYP